MTQEIPERAKESDPIFCETCNAVVRLERTETDGLLLRCPCDDYRMFEPIGGLPSGWTDE